MNVLEILKPVTTIILDVDGVLTDGTIYVFSGVDQIRAMNAKDGYALQLAVKRGYNIVVITGGKHVPVKERLNALGVTEVYLDTMDKLPVLKSYMAKNNLTREQVLYMGDDIPDKPCMEYVGVGCCPADAAQEIKAVAQYISPLPGGRACVRDVIEKVMKLQNKWQTDEQITSA